MADVIYTESGEQFIVVGNEAVSEIVTEVATYPEVVETITAGPQGAPGSMSNEVSIVAGEAIGGHRVIALDTAGHGVYADCLTNHVRILGVSRGAAASGDRVNVVAFGEFEEPSWSFDPQKGLFLGASGAIVQDAPDTGAIVPIGIVMNPTRIFVSINYRIERE